MLTFTCYTKAFARKGPVKGLLEADVVTRHLAQGTASFTITRDNPRWAWLMGEGSRVVCRWGDDVILSGRVTAKRGESGDASSRWTFEVTDDFVEVAALLGWPVPGNVLGSQTSAYDVRTGTEEGILKALVTANATRLGIPLTVATNLARGATIKTSHRFHPLLDRFPVKQSTLGITARQVGTGVVVDVYEPVVRAAVLRAPVVRDWTVDYTAPTVTRVVAGNQGDGAARAFLARVNATREADWAMKREVFLDARDTDDTTETYQRMDELLAEGAPTAAARVVLAEANHFRVGSSYNLGDQVSVLLDPDLPVLTETVREVRYQVGPNQAPTVTPVLGDLVVPESVIPRAIAAVRKTVQNLSRS